MNEALFFVSGFTLGGMVAILFILAVLLRAGLWNSWADSPSASPNFSPHPSGGIFECQQCGRYDDNVKSQTLCRDCQIESLLKGEAK